MSCAKRDISGNISEPKTNGFKIKISLVCMSLSKHTLGDRIQGLR